MPFANEWTDKKYCYILLKRREIKQGAEREVVGESSKWVETAV